MLELMAAQTPTYSAIALQSLFGKPSIFEPDITLLWMVPRLPTIHTNIHTNFPINSNYLSTNCLGFRQILVHINHFP